MNFDATRRNESEKIFCRKRRFSLLLRGVDNSPAAVLHDGGGLVLLRHTSVRPQQYISKILFGSQCPDKFPTLFVGVVAHEESIHDEPPGNSPNRADGFQGVRALFVQVHVVEFVAGNVRQQLHDIRFDLPGDLRRDERHVIEAYAVTVEEARRD